MIYFTLHFRWTRRITNLYNQKSYNFFHHLLRTIHFHADSPKTGQKNKHTVSDHVVVVDDSVGVSGGPKIVAPRAGRK